MVYKGFLINININIRGMIICLVRDLENEAMLLDKILERRWGRVELNEKTLNTWLPLTWPTGLESSSLLSFSSCFYLPTWWNSSIWRIADTIYIIPFSCHYHPHDSRTKKGETEKEIRKSERVSSTMMQLIVCRARFSVSSSRLSYHPPSRIKGGMPHTVNSVTTTYTCSSCLHSKIWSTAKLKRLFFHPNVWWDTTSVEGRKGKVYLVIMEFGTHSFKWILVLFAIVSKKRKISCLNYHTGIRRIKGQTQSN